MGLSGPLFGFSVFLGSLYIIQLTILINGARKQERRLRVCTVLFVVLWKKPSAQRELVFSNSERKKAKSILGFEPGLLGQNTTAQLLAPPPQPFFMQTLIRLKKVFFIPRANALVPLLDVLVAWHSACNEYDLLQPGCCLLKSAVVAFGDKIVVLRFFKPRREKPGFDSRQQLFTYFAGKGRALSS